MFRCHSVSQEGTPRRGRAGPKLGRSPAGRSIWEAVAVPLCLLRTDMRITPSPSSCATRRKLFPSPAAPADLRVHPPAKVAALAADQSSPSDGARNLTLASDASSATFVTVGCNMASSVIATPRRSSRIPHNLAIAACNLVVVASPS